MNDENSKEDELRFENEVKKLKLMAEREAKFFPGNTELPAELEAQWLDNIMAFEEAADKKDYKKIKDILGNPSLPPADTITEKGLSETLNTVYNMLDENNISLDVLYDVSDRELYRFIIEELFEEEMSAIIVPGMISCFIYEEFHPNDMEDLKRYSEEFIDMVMSKNFEYLDSNLSSKVIFDNRTIPSKEFVEELEQRIEGYELIFNGLVIDSIEIEGSQASVALQLDYEIQSLSGSFSHYNKIARLGFVHELDYWYIQEVEIPGL